MIIKEILGTVLDLWDKWTFHNDGTNANNHQPFRRSIRAPGGLTDCLAPTRYNKLRPRRRWTARALLKSAHTNLHESFSTILRQRRKAGSIQFEARRVDRDSLVCVCVSFMTMRYTRNNLPANAGFGITRLGQDYTYRPP